jgi:hypothetical protein
MSISSIRGERTAGVLSALAFGFFSACSGGGGSPPLGEVPTGQGEDDGESTPPPYVPGGDVIAFLQTANPNMNSFVLRGTVPLPPGTFPRGDGQIPFTLLDSDGSPVWTQVEIVSRYPDVADGADVVEIIGRVHPYVGSPIDAQVNYLVQENLQPAQANPGAVDITDLGQTRGVLPLVIGLLTDSEGIEIAAYDVFGHKYVVKPLDGSGTMEHRRIGRARSEVRISQNMLPVNPVGGANATLPHLFGVQTYITTYTGQEVVGLDIRFHNGHSGNDPSTEEDNPLDRIYFQRIEISIPETFLIQQQFEDPMFAEPFRSGGRRIGRIVDTNADGRPHVMRWLGQFHRRLMLSTTAAEDIARNYLDGAGQAFCKRGMDPSNSHELYSWWRADTARYFPQNHQLPALDHVGLAGLRNSLNAQHNSLETHLLEGTGQGSYPLPFGILGWMHPFGVTYGGMTGGSEIYLFDGVSLAATGTPKGYRYYQALHRMATSRQPMAFYNGDGSPSSVEDWLIGNPGSPGAWVPMSHFLVPFTGGSFQDPFGFGDAPQHQIQHVENLGIEPSYQNTHLSYQPYDYQHFIRYTRSPKVLSWLGNDSIAKDDLLAMAEAFHLSYHPYANNSGGGYMSTGMKSDQEAVLAFPGLGMSFGRGESWGLDTMVAAYALGTPAWRATKRPFLQAVTQLLVDAQSSCAGFIQAQHMGSVPVPTRQPTYFWRQMIEQSITENMLWGLRETVFEGDDPPRSAMLRDTLINSLYAMISPLAWGYTQNAPWQYTAVGLNPDISAQGPSVYWCTELERPADARTGSHDWFQNWSSFAYGYELTGDMVFLDFALLQTDLLNNGGGNLPLLQECQAEGTENLENLAALLALEQVLANIL